MIDRNNHYARYSELMSLACVSSPARQHDGGYMAALYILSADPELFSLSRCRVDASGIGFSAILSAALRLDLSDSQYTAIRAAHNLFNTGSRSQNTPQDLAQCSYDVLDVIVDALYIWKRGCAITADEAGQIRLDRSGEAKRRSFDRAISASLFSAAN